MQRRNFFNSIIASGLGLLGFGSVVKGKSPKIGVDPAQGKDDTRTIVYRGFLEWERMADPGEAIINVVPLYFGE